MALVAACREAATVGECLAVARELMRVGDAGVAVHVLPKKAFFVFTLVSRRLWFAQTRGAQGSRDELVPVWDMLTELLTSFAADELDSVKDDLMKLVFDEYEKGTAGSREAAWRFVSAVERDAKLREAFRVDYDVAVGGRKSPSFSDALRSCQDGRLWAPLFRLIEASSQSKLDKGVSTFDRLFFRTDDRCNLYPLLACGSVAYPLIVISMFPVMSKESTRKASKKTASSIDLGMSLLQAAFGKVPHLVAPLFAFIVEACAANYSAEEVIHLVAKFQSMLSSANNPWMADLVRATRGIRDQEWCRGWAWKLVASALAEKRGALLSDTSLKTFAAVLEVTPTVAFKIVDAGMLVVPVEGGEGHVQVMKGLVQAHSTLRALPDFFRYLLSLNPLPNKQLSIRDAYVHPSMRPVAKSALAACLPSVASALALAPRDEVSAVMVGDILKWGPIGAEAKASGWDALAWGKAVCGWARENGAQLLLECFLDALHYRWDPLLLEAVMGSGCFGLRDGSHLTDVQRVRLARDFPRYWSTPENVVLLCERILQASADPDWSLLLWSGGMSLLRAWLTTAPLHSFQSIEASEAWTKSVRVANETISAVKKCGADRAHAIMTAVSLEVVALYSGKSKSKVVDAFVAGAALDRLAEFLTLFPVFCEAAEKRWLKKKVPLGPQVAVVLKSEAVWKAALKLDRPAVWPYVAACGNVLRALKTLVGAGAEAWVKEDGCWAVWRSILLEIDGETWRKKVGPELAASLLSVLWREKQWVVLAEYHSALSRIGLAEGAALAMRKSLALILSGKTQIDDATVSKLLSLADYGLALAATRKDLSCRVLHLLLSLPSDAHDRPLLRRAMPFLMTVAIASSERLRAATCAERFIRLIPPYDAGQLAYYLQPCILDERSSAALVRLAMAALDTARRVCPSVWFRGAGIVAAFEARALSLVAKFSDEEWVQAARAVGREIGGGGADLKQRKYYLAFAMGNWLSHGEPRASLAVRTAVWQEGLVAAMESAVTESDQAFSFHMVTGANSNKASWKRYKRKYDEQEKYTGKL